MAGIQNIIYVFAVLQVSLPLTSCKHCSDSNIHLPHVVGAQLYRLSTLDAHTDVLKPIHGKII